MRSVPAINSIWIGEAGKIRVLSRPFSQRGGGRGPLVSYILNGRRLTVAREEFLATFAPLSPPRDWTGLSAEYFRP